MDKEQLTLDDIREAIKNVCCCTQVGEHVSQMSDEAFAPCNFAEDFGMDSMDVVEVTVWLENNRSVSIPNSAVEFVIGHNTVRTMLDKYNECLAQ